MNNPLARGEHALSFFPPRGQCRYCNSHTDTETCGTCGGSDIGPVDGPVALVGFQEGAFPGLRAAPRAAGARGGEPGRRHL